ASGTAAIWNATQSEASDGATVPKKVRVRGRFSDSIRCDDSRSAEGPDGVLVYHLRSETGFARLPINCIPVHRLLRVRNTGRTAGGTPLFTIVFSKPNVF